MNRKKIGMLAIMMTMGTMGAFAANPFVDVPTDSWAYQSVVTLADAGVIQGVDGQYFQGGRTITRYEAAEMTAKAMAHMDTASVEQRALIHRLADEYAGELQSLGIRVTALENKVGNIKVSGDARVRFRNQSRGRNGNSLGKKNDNSWDYHVNLNANAQVNDHVQVHYQLTTDEQGFADNTAAQEKKNNPFTRLANVEYTTDHWTMTVGRYTYKMGGGMGLQYSHAFDGAQASYHSGHWKLTGGYGKFKKDSDFIFSNIIDRKGQDLQNLKAGYAMLDGSFGRVGAGVYYNQFNHSGSANEYPTTAMAKNLDYILGGYLSVNMANSWSVLGDYQRIFKQNETATDQNADLWGAKVSYGKAVPSVKGSWTGWLEYIDADPYALYGFAGSWRYGDMLDNIRSWGAGITYVLDKNVVLTAGQTFGSQAKRGGDPSEFTNIEVSCFF